MVMADAVIHFRFKNETTLDKFAFSGSSISVKELKNHISAKHKLDQVSSRPDKRQAPSELSLQNDATGEVYTNDDTEIPKDTTVLVARRLLGGENGDKVAEEPAIKEPTSVAAEPVKKVIERNNSEHNLDHYHSGHGYRGEMPQGLQDPEFVELGFPTLITTTTDISELDQLTEDQKILAMMYQCLLFYDHTAYVSRARMSQNQNPPPNYICKNCGGTGHWPNRCPNASEQNYHAPPRRNAQMRAPVMKPTTENTNPAPYATIPVDNGPEYEDIPVDLQCNLCQRVIRNAVKLPCCEKSYCDDCVQTKSLSDDNNCPNCGAEFKYDECLPNQLLRDSVEKYERDMQIKKQRRRDEVSKPNAGHMKEPSTPPAIPGGPGGRNVVRPTKNVTRPDHHQYGHHNQQRQQQQQQQQHHPQDRTPPSNEPQQIGSLTRATPSVNVNLFHTPHIPGPRDRNAGGSFPQNNSMFNMGNNARPRQPAANPAQMGFYAGSQYGDTSGAAFGPAAYAMGGAWRGAMPYGGVMPGMAGMRYPGVAFGMGHPAAVRAMYGQQLPTIPAQAMVAGGQQQQPLPNLRITRIPNTPKVPVQAPHNDDPPRRSPEKSSRSDDKDYRDKDRRDKDDDRRRDERSSKYDKYDDRDRRRNSRSPERRRSRDYSPDRRDRKRETSSRSDDKKDSRLSDRDRRKRDENLSPASKVKSDREKDKDKSDRTERKIETIGSVKREKEPEKLPEVAVEKPVPEVKGAKEEESTTNVKPLAEVKAEPSQLTEPSLETTSVDAKEKPAVVEVSKPVEEPMNLSAKVSLPPVNESTPQATKEALDSPPKEKEREDTDKASDASSSLRKEDGSRSKKSRSSRRDKDKDRKKDKRARSESEDQKSSKKRSSRKNSNDKEEGETEPPSTQENAEKSRTSSRAEEEKPAPERTGEKEDRSEKRSGKSSRSSRKDKDRSSKDRKPSDRDEEREEKGATWKDGWKSREKRPRSESPKADKRDVKKRADESSSQKPSDRDKDKDRKSHRSKRDDEAKDKEKSSHKSRSSKKDKEKSTKSGKEKDEAASTSKIVDARNVVEGIRLGKESNGDKERSSRKRDASVESREAGEVVEGKHKSSRSHKSKSKKDKSSKTSRSDKHSKREASPSTEKKKHKKKHRKEKKGEGSRSSVTEENAAAGS